MSLTDRFLRKGEDWQLLKVSPTVATLDARTQFATLRRLLSSERAEIHEELDRLTEHLADVLVAFDGLAPPSELESRDEELRDLRAEGDDMQDRMETAEQRLEELLQAADDSPKKLTSKLAKASETEADLRAQLARAKAARMHAEDQVKNLNTLLMRERAKS